MESNDYGKKSPAVFKLRRLFSSVMTTGDIIRRFGIDLVSALLSLKTKI